ncbi:DUF3054 domain-containing protein [Microbacterium sp. AGC85]
MTENRMPVALVVIIDVILVTVFCVIGRLSHAEGVFSDVPGLLNTIWPFLTAVLFAHLSALVVRVRTERMLPGIVVWAVTVIGGLALREAAGQGAALAFIVVATLTLALFLLGWRGVLAIMRRVRRRPVA